MHGVARHLQIDAEQIAHGLRFLVHQRRLLRRVAADADAEDRRRDAVAEKPRQQPAMRARAARADDHAVEVQAEFEALLLQLLRARHVAEAAERVGAAAGNDVPLAPPGRERSSASRCIAAAMSVPAGTTVIASTPQSRNRKWLPLASSR